MEPFPWQAAMAFGFGVLKLSSAEFWALTPLELAAAMRAHGHNNAQPIERAKFQELMAKYPDKSPSK